MYVLIENNGVSLGHWVNGNFPSASRRGPAGSNDLSSDSVLIMILPDMIFSVTELHIAKTSVIDAVFYSAGYVPDSLLF